MRIEGLYDRGYFVTFSNGDEALYRTPMNYIFGIGDTFHVIQEDDDLLKIAQKYFGNQYLWYLIADANNNIEDIFDLTINETLIIPNISVIFSMYG